MLMLSIPNTLPRCGTESGTRPVLNSRKLQVMFNSEVVAVTCPALRGGINADFLETKAAEGLKIEPDYGF